MALLILVVGVALMGWGWLLQPITDALSAVLRGTWLGWILLGLAVWLFSGPGRAR